MPRRLTLLFVATLALAGCGSDSDDTTPPTQPSPGTSRLSISPQPDFLTVGASIVLEARLTEGTSPPRVVPADWSSLDGRVVAVDRTGRISALAAGSTTVQATFSTDTARLTVRAVPDLAGTWTGNRRVVACIHPRADFCAATYPVNQVRATTLVMTQSRDRTTGTLSFSPPAASPSAAVTGAIAESGRLTLDGTIVSTPGSGATITLGRLSDFRADVESVTGFLRGSFVEARTDSDGTTWSVSWELQGLARTR
jgi:hypothetical protein